MRSLDQKLRIDLSMPWEPGQSGNPSGTTPKEKRFRAALDRAIAQDDGQMLRDAAEKLLYLAAKGEAWAVRELADRLDGRPSQEVVGSVEHNFIALVPPLQKDPEEWVQSHTPTTQH